MFVICQVFDNILLQTRAVREKIDWHDYKSIEAEKRQQGKLLCLNQSQSGMF